MRYIYFLEVRKMQLEEKRCVPCKGGIPPLTETQAKELLAKVDGWELIDAATRIRRMFRFANFVEAQEFAVNVGRLAEDQGHHPDICYGWGYCTVVFYTHKIGGLHENDFIMAARVNALLED